MCLSLLKSNVVNIDIKHTEEKEHNYGNNIFVICLYINPQYIDCYYSFNILLL